MSATGAEAKPHWAHETSWLLVGNVARNAGFIAVLILLAQLTTPTLVGRYSLALAITLPIFVLAQLSLKNLYLTNHSSHAFSAYHRLQLLSLAVAVPLSVVIALIAFPAAALTVFLVALVKVNDALCDLYAGPMQEFHRARLVARGYGVEALISTAVVAVLLVLTRDLNLALTGLAVVSLGLTAWLMLVPARRLARADVTTPKVSTRAELGALARNGLPIGIGLAIFSLVLSAPQYALAAFRGDASVGYFTAIVYSIAVVDLVLNTVTQGWIPGARAAFWARVQAGTSFRRYVGRSTAIWTGLFVPLTAIGIFALALAVPIVLGPAYVPSFPEYVALAVCVLISPSHHFSGVGLAVMNHYRRMLPPNVAAAGVTIAASIALIPGLGSTGAILAIVAGLATKAILSFALMRMPRPGSVTRPDTEESAVAS